MNTFSDTNTHTLQGLMKNIVLDHKSMLRKRKIPFRQIYCPLIKYFQLKTDISLKVLSDSLFRKLHHQTIFKPSV